MSFNWEALERYLSDSWQTNVSIDKVAELGGTATGAEALKQCGYGKPLYLEASGPTGSERMVVHRVRRNGFGRERADDRVAAVWLDYHTFNQLDKHIVALDMILRRKDDTLESIGDGQELLLLTAFQPGRPYAEDLRHLGSARVSSDRDRRRAHDLAVYLARIHRVSHDDPLLWRRRLRDLVGHGEGIMGLTDSYPENPTFTTADELRKIEEMANAWRWRLKPLTERLRQVHGDFHPFNVVFEEHGDEFHVLDRSRGPWGAAADDLSCMSINYIFFSLLQNGRFEGALAQLHRLFWKTYKEKTNDDAIEKVIQPWIAWRALVLASPRWYPDLEDRTRRVLLELAKDTLEAPRYNHDVVLGMLEKQ